MVNTTEDNVKNNIIKAAQTEFFSKGYDGARMQSIADAAKVNKAMLHYYFKSKENLFQEIMSSAFQQVFPQIEAILATDSAFFEKLEKIYHTYFDMLQRNPQLPLFINTELARGNVKLKEVLPFAQKANFKSRFSELVKEEIAAKRIKPIDPTFLFMNLLSLTIFPVLARSTVMIGLNIDSFSYELMLEERKKQLPQFIIDAIKL